MSKETSGEHISESLSPWTKEAEEALMRGVDPRRMEARMDAVVETVEEDLNPSWRKSIPLIFHHAELDKKILLSDPQSVLIVGPNGVGKSYMAAALAREWKATWYSVPRVNLALKRTWRKDAERSEGELADELVTHHRVIVLDDLMAGQRFEGALAFLLLVINERIESNRVTVVTSDKDLPTIDKIDSSLASRLGSFLCYELKGKDRRVI